MITTGVGTDSGVQLQPVLGGAMLYDSSTLSNAQEGWLRPDWWARRGQVSSAGAGRGAAWLIQAGPRRMVLRHYRRGGLIARLSEDHYWWCGAEQTRSFREWRLLRQLWNEGLPVPQPIAAGYRRQGSTYSADILMDYLPGTQSLARRLEQSSLPLVSWIDIGRCIRRFVDAGVHHADLNAHNVLLDAEDRIWLVDFDRARVRAAGLWSDAMLARLHSSLRKLTDALPSERFTTADWHALLDAYLSGASRQRA